MGSVPMNRARYIPETSVAFDATKVTTPSPFWVCVYKGPPLRLENPYRLLDLSFHPATRPPTVRMVVASAASIQTVNPGMDFGSNP